MNCSHTRRSSSMEQPGSIREEESLYASEALGEIVTAICNASEHQGAVKREDKDEGEEFEDGDEDDHSTMGMVGFDDDDNAPNRRNPVEVKMEEESFEEAPEHIVKTDSNDIGSKSRVVVKEEVEESEADSTVGMVGIGIGIHDPITINNSGKVKIEDTEAEALEQTRKAMFKNIAHAAIVKEEVGEDEDGHSTAGNVGIGEGEHGLKRNAVKVEEEEEIPGEIALEQFGDAKSEQHVKVKSEETDNEGNTTYSINWTCEDVIGFISDDEEEEIIVEEQAGDGAIKIFQMAKSSYFVKLAGKMPKSEDCDRIADYDMMRKISLDGVIELSDDEVINETVPKKIKKTREERELERELKHLLEDEATQKIRKAKLRRKNRAAKIAAKRKLAEPVDETLDKKLENDFIILDSSSTVKRLRTEEVVGAKRNKVSRTSRNGKRPNRTFDQEEMKLFDDLDRICKTMGVERSQKSLVTEDDENDDDDVEMEDNDEYEDVESEGEDIEESDGDDEQEDEECLYKDDEEIDVDQICSEAQKLLESIEKA